MEDHQKNIVVNLLAYGVQRDISSESLCKLSGITSHLLNDKEKRLSQKQVGDVWLNAIHLSNDQCFGLHFGESLQLAALGIIGDIIKTSRTVGEAINNAMLIVPQITDAFTLTIIHSGDTFSIDFIPFADDWEHLIPVVHILDLLMAFVVHEMDGLLLKKIIPQEVYYPLNVNNAAEYERVMRCKPHFGANKCSIIFPVDYWNEPIITANYELQHLLMQNIPLFKKQANEKQTLSGRIHNYLLENSYLGMVSLEDIASNFNLSTRTMQRKLKEEGINFQQITDKVRMDLAISYLKAGDVHVKQVCYLLGYNELSSFSRTFKRWTGVTPGQFVKTQYVG